MVVLRMIGQNMITLGVALLCGATVLRIFSIFVHPVRAHRNLAILAQAGGPKFCEQFVLELFGICVIRQ